MTNTTQTDSKNRKWFSRVALVTAPVLAGVLLLTYLNGAATVALSSDLPETTTTATTADETAANNTPLTILDHGDEDPVDGGWPNNGGNNEGLGEEEGEGEVPSDDGPDDPLADPLLSAPSEVVLDGTGAADIKVTNVGELPLEITGINVYGNPIAIVSLPGAVGAYSHKTLAIQVDTTGLPFGAFEMGMTIATNGGSQDIVVKGFKPFLIFVPTADLDFSTNWIVPHQAQGFTMNVINNEDYDVVVTFNTEDERFLMNDGDEITLEPGDNNVYIAILPLNVPWNTIDLLTFSYSWGFQNVGVTVTKHGI